MINGGAPRQDYIVDHDRRSDGYDIERREEGFQRVGAVRGAPFGPAEGPSQSEVAERSDRSAIFTYRFAILYII